MRRCRRRLATIDEKQVAMEKKLDIIRSGPYAVSKPGQHAEMLSYIGMLQAMDFKLDIILDEVDNSRWMKYPPRYGKLDTILSIPC